MKPAKLLCMFGIHKWKYTSSSHDADRICDRCSRYEIASYDMAYGCTFYEKAMRLRRLSWKEIRGNNRWQLRIGKTAQIDPNVIFELGDEAKPTEVGDGCKILSGSVISYGCKLGLGVFINFNTTLLPDVQIGNRTNIGPNTVIESHVSIGEICSIRANCYIPSFTVIAVSYTHLTLPTICSV